VALALQRSSPETHADDAVIQDRWVEVEVEVEAVVEVETRECLQE
jgi:hypothetical protein